VSHPHGPIDPPVVALGARENSPSFFHGAKHVYILCDLISIQIPALVSYYYGGCHNSHLQGIPVLGYFFVYSIHVSTCTVVTSPCLSGWCHNSGCGVSQIWDTWVGRDETKITPVLVLAGTGVPVPAPEVGHVSCSL
jgi:hypothetical protein